MNDMRKLLRGLEVLSGCMHEREFESKVFSNPHELFLEWFEASVEANLPEPHAMVLSTIDHENNPDGRTLILKDVDSRGWYFAISNLSPKGKNIKHNNNVALTFYWQGLARQVRIRGLAKELSDSVNAQDFLSRSKSARALALAGKQSDQLVSPDDIEVKVTSLLMKIDNNPELTSPNWKVYCVEPIVVEFWQGAQSRRHRRLVFRRNGNKFARENLWP